MSRLASIPEDRTRDDPLAGTLPDWWAAVYDHVFIALHPLTEAPDDPEAADLDWYAHTAQATNRSWSAVARDLGGCDFGDFVLALLFARNGMTSRSRRPGMRPVADDGLIERLAALAECDRLSWPWDSSPSPALWPAFAATFVNQGAREVTAWSEFRESSANLTVDALAAGAVGSLPFGPYAFQSHTPAILVTASFDHMWTLIALTNEGRSRFDPATHFEGFWAGPSTSAKWINEPGTYDPLAGWPQ